MRIAILVAVVLVLAYFAFELATISSFRVATLRGRFSRSLSRILLRRWYLRWLSPRANRWTTIRPWPDLLVFFVVESREAQLVLAAITIAVLPFMFRPSATPLEWAGLALAIVVSGRSVISFWHDRVRVNDTRTIEVRDGHRPHAPSGSENEGELLPIGNRTWIVYPRLNAHMRQHKLRSRVVVENRARLSGRWRKMAPSQISYRHSEAHNEPKLRLCASPHDLIDERSARLRLTDYFSSLYTCNVAGKIVVVDGVDVYDGEEMLRKADNTYRQYFEPDCSSEHHVGVNSFILTKDGQCLLQEQYINNIQSAGHLTSSGSGSLNCEDVRVNEPLEVGITRGCLRECEEELGIIPGDWPRYSEVHIGMAVDVGRALIPDFHMLICIDEDYATFIDTRCKQRQLGDGRQFLGDPERIRLESRKAACEDIQRIMGKLSGKQADVLLVGLRFWLDAIEDETAWKAMRTFYAP